MQPQDKNKFLELMEQMAEIYDKVPTEKGMEIYFDVLGDVSIEEITKKAEIHMKTQPFFPKPCDLRMTMEDEYNEQIEKEHQAMIKEGERK